MLTFSQERDLQEVDIPAELEADAHVWRDVLLEKLYNFSDEMAELRSTSNRFRKN